MLSLANLAVIFLSAVLACMVAVLVFASSRFPMILPASQPDTQQQQGGRHLPTNARLSVKRRIRHHNRRVPDILLARHENDASAADGASDVALWPRMESQDPPRVYYCNCYSQVKYALATRGFSMKRRTGENDDDYHGAWIIWKTNTNIDMKSLLPWQRPSHFPGERLMDRKGTMYQVLREYSQKHMVPLDFVPETFALYDKDDKTRFVRRLDHGGMNTPWVLKNSKGSRGRGITMLGPRSVELTDLRDELDGGGPVKRHHIIQSFIPNEWTYQGHKCDLRVYVLVASVEPLIVYYHDGIVRTATSLYNETDFGNNGRAQLTNVSQNKMNRTLWEPVKTFHDLDRELRRTHVVPQQQQPPRGDDGEHDPMRDIRDQIKKILGTVFAAFASRISLDGLPIDNAFAVMGADFVIDRDLKVWLLEMQLGPQLVGDNHAEKIAILQDVLTTSIDLVQEVFHKQSRKEPLLPLTKTGNFELVYHEEQQQQSDQRLEPAVKE